MQNKYWRNRLRLGAGAIMVGLAYACAHGDLAPEKPGLDDWLRDGKLTLHLRNYYLYRSLETAPAAESMAGGGWLAYESALWHDLGFGLAGYTAQGWGFTDPDHDGAGLLAPGQHSYSVLGEAYMRFAPGDWNAVLYRQALDTPFVNLDDCRMTPRTFEAYTLENCSLPDVHITLSHVVAMKGRTNTTFKSMTAGAYDCYTDHPELGATDRPLTLAGLIWAPNTGWAKRIQIWNYLAYDYMNTFFAQWDAAWHPHPVYSISLSAQGMDQRDIGDALGGAFHTAQGGVQAGVLAWGLELLVAGTIVDNRYPMQSPWGSYPGYTSLILEDNNRAGDKTWALGLNYDIGQLGLPGLSLSAWRSHSYTPDTGAHASPDQTETDVTLKYVFPGWLRNLDVRLRWADVNQSPTAGGSDYTDYRAIVNYIVDLMPIKRK